MKSEFQKYLKDIGVTEPIQDRVEHFYGLCGKIGFENLQDIFVDDYLTEDKSRKYTGLSFFSKNLIFSVPNFLTDDKINIANQRTWINRIAITVQNFDFIKANDKSLISVHTFHDASDTGFYKASQKNCVHLVRILRKYIRPSLMKREIKISSGR